MSLVLHAKSHKNSLKGNWKFEFPIEELNKFGIKIKQTVNAHYLIHQQRVNEHFFVPSLIVKF